MSRSGNRLSAAFAAAAMLQAAFAVAAAPPAAHPERAAEAPASSPATSGAETGLAAVYSDRLDGRRTASGKRYDRNALTTAHKSLPFGTRVRVTNTHNRRSVELVVNDRGPTQPGRVLDISPAAAKKLGIHRRGMAEVTVEVIGHS